MTNRSLLLISRHTLPLPESSAFNNFHLHFRCSLSHFYFCFLFCFFSMLSPFLYFHTFEEVPTFYFYVLLKVLHCYYLNRGSFPLRQD